MVVARLKPGEANRNRVIGLYRRRVKKENLKKQQKCIKNNIPFEEISFNLTIPQWEYLFKNDCIYCGLKPSSVENSPSCPGEYVYSGIDRLIGNKGYVVGNVVSCCRMCNVTKVDMTPEEYLEMNRKVSKTLEKYNEN